jgi:peptidoglycan hydrolase-like protein with peptidoglycan-binding domain
LIALGYLDQAAIGNMGTFDQATQNAVTQLQGDYQLTADGRVGPMTYSAAGSCIPANQVSNYTS